MSRVLVCLVSLALANFLVESWKDIADYEHAAFATWSQAWALIIYHFIWEKE